MELSFVKKTTDFYDYVDHVIDWNKVCCGGKHDFSKEKIALQKTFVQEEYKELVDGIKNLKEVEVIDALADLVVTVGYWLYLREPALIKNSCELLNYSMGANYVDMLAHDIENDDAWRALQCVMALCHQVDFQMDATIREVLRSNDTKTPTVEDYKVYAGEMWKEQLNAECDFLNNKFKGRYTGIHWTEVGDKIVFHDDKGKVIKPVKFSEADLTNFI